MRVKVAPPAHVRPRTASRRGHVAELLGHSGTAMLHKHYAYLGRKAAALRAALGRLRS